MVLLQVNACKGVCGHSDHDSQVRQQLWRLHIGAQISQLPTSFGVTGILSATWISCAVWFIMATV